MEKPWSTGSLDQPEIAGSEHPDTQCREGREFESLSVSAEALAKADRPLARFTEMSKFEAPLKDALRLPSGRASI